MMVNFEKEENEDDEEDDSDHDLTHHCPTLTREWCRPRWSCRCPSSWEEVWLEQVQDLQQPGREEKQKSSWWEYQGQLSSKISLQGDFGCSSRGLDSKYPQARLRQVHGQVDLLCGLDYLHTSTHAHILSLLSSACLWTQLGGPLGNNWEHRRPRLATIGRTLMIESRQTRWHILYWGYRRCHLPISLLYDFGKGQQTLWHNEYKGCGHWTTKSWARKLLQSYRGLLQVNDLIYEEGAKYVSDFEKVPRRFLIGLKRDDNLYSTQMLLAVLLINLMFGFLFTANLPNCCSHFAILWIFGRK